MSPPAWYDWVEKRTGLRPRGHQPLSGGCIAALYRLSMPGGDGLVIKMAEAGAMALEARMLIYLAQESELPVPEVIAWDDGKLLMTFIETSGHLGASSEQDAADKLAALHAITADAYGFDYDTVIGGIPQPNGWMEDWLSFFRERRLLYMADLCLDKGLLDAAERKRFDVLAGKLGDIIGDASAPGLIHGDMWGGNVLARDGAVAGFVDPAIYYADPEIELAFSTLFNTFGDAFFARYAEHRPIRARFFEERRDLYNLWHLMNHVWLFGRGYWSGVTATLAKFGC